MEKLQRWEDLIQKRNFQITFSIGLLILYFAVFIKIAPHDDYVSFGGDTISYQSMGVNFAKGHGLQRDGFIERFEKYKFTLDKKGREFDYFDALPNEEQLKKSVATQGHYNFYRNMFYPLFVGVVYKIFGISPQILKGVQLFLFCIVAVGLCWIGAYYWKVKGFFAGLIAGFPFLLSTYEITRYVLTENIILFLLFLLVLAWIYYEIKQNFVSASLIGVIFGILVLTKGSLMLIPVIIGIALLVKSILQKNKTLFIKLALMAGFAVITVAPYSAYASSHHGKFVLSNTQGEDLIMAGHNELVLWIGSWRADWVSNPDVYYNRKIKMLNPNAQLGDASVLGGPFNAVIDFYQSNPGMFYDIAMTKMYFGFTSFGFLSITFVLLSLNFINQLSKKYAPSVQPFVLLLSCALASLAVYRFIFYDNYQITPHFYPYHSLALTQVKYKLFLTLLVGVLGIVAAFRKDSLLKIPFIFQALFINALIVTFLFFASTDVMYSRFVKGVEFMFDLVGVVCLIEFVRNYLKEFGYEPQQINTLPKSK